jgi:hypothetical protein
MGLRQVGSELKLCSVRRSCNTVEGSVLNSGFRSMAFFSLFKGKNNPNITPRKIDFSSTHLSDTVAAVAAAAPPCSADAVFTDSDAASPYSAAKVDPATTASDAASPDAAETATAAASCGSADAVTVDGADTSSDTASTASMASFTSLTSSLSPATFVRSVSDSGTNPFLCPVFVSKDPKVIGSFELSPIAKSLSPPTGDTAPDTASDSRFDHLHAFCKLKLQFSDHLKNGLFTCFLHELNLLVNCENEDSYILDLKETLNENVDLNTFIKEYDSRDNVDSKGEKLIVNVMDCIVNKMEGSGLAVRLGLQNIVKKIYQFKQSLFNEAKNVHQALPQTVYVSQIPSQSGKDGFTFESTLGYLFYKSSVALMDRILS